MNHKIFIGTAGWALPPQSRDLFTGEGSNLEKYSRFLNATEINSSFYRDHKPETYRKWAEAVSDDFRFSVKLNKYFTREKRLTEAGDKLRQTLEPIFELKEKFGALLIQLPGKLEFTPSLADKFFRSLRHNYDGEVVLEPRHLSWTAESAVELLSEYSINKVLADPEPCRIPKKFRPSVELTTYFRLHGSPDMYKSRYSPEVISRIAAKVKQVADKGNTVWCIFDNTTLGHGLDNALELTYTLENQIDDEQLSQVSPSHPIV